MGPPVIKLGRLTRRTSPNGVTFLSGDIGNLKITILAEPDIEPGEAGDMVFTVYARQSPNFLRREAARRSRLPERAPFDLVPPSRPLGELQPEPVAAARASAAPRPSKAEQTAAAAADIMFRCGPILDPGDELPEVMQPKAATDEAVTASDVFDPDR